MYQVHHLELTAKYMRNPGLAGSQIDLRMPYLKTLKFLCRCNHQKKQQKNKKVPLRERKRHTARCVAGTCCAGQGGYPG